MNSLSHDSGAEKIRRSGGDAERYQSLFNSIDEGFCVIEMIFDESGAPVDWEFLEINPAFELQTGLAGALGRRVRELIPGHEQHWFDTYGAVALTGTPTRFENFSVGLNRWFSLYAFRTGEPGDHHVAVLFNDITARKQAERRAGFLTALSRKLAPIVAEADIVRIAVDAVGTHLNADRCYFVECLESEQLVVVSHNWLRGQSRSLEGRFSLYDFGGIEWWEHYSRGDFAVEDVRTHPLTRDKLASYEAIGVRAYAVQPFLRDGKWTVVIGVTETSPRKWTPDELSVMEDVIARVWPLVERARTNQALSESKARLEFTLESARVGDWDLDLIAKTTRRSLRHDQAFGYAEPLAEWNFEKFLTHVHPDDRPEVSRKFSEAVAGLKEWHFECRVIWPDGTLHWIEAHGDIYRTAGGQPRNMLGIVTDITARKRAEGALQSSEERHRQMLQRLPVACCTLDAGGRITFFNEAARELWGRTPKLGEEFWCGSHAMETLDGQPLPISRYPAAQAFNERRTIREVEAYVIRPDGERRHVIPHPDPLYDADGKFAGVINVIVDVTEQRAVEVTLRESEAFLQSVIGASADCLKVMDLDGRLQWMSDNGQRVMEVCDFSAIQSKYWPELWKDEAGRKKVEASIQAAREGRNTHFRGLCDTAAGTPKWWDVIVSPIVEGGGKPTQILSVSRDITAVREVERALDASREALKEHSIALELRVEELRIAKTEAESASRSSADSAERFRLLSEVIALQVWTANTRGELDYANQECIAYLGGELERDILGDAWLQYVHADDRPETLRAWQTSLAGGNRYEVEFRMRGRDGTFRWFLARAEAMRDRDGHIIRWFGTNTEIHDLKTAQNAAESASRAKDDFLAALSHELRTPLTPVLMSAASLREDERLPADVREQLGMMERNISLEARLIDDLLDLTKISHGKLQLRAQPCDAHSLIGLAIEIVRDDAHAKEISIKCQFEARHSGLVADPARFQQVIWNLLRNAVKFTPQGGNISIRTSENKNEQGSNWLRIEIADSGIGIEPARIDHIFLPFDQGGLTGDHRFGGVGLGLAIARAVIDLHGGRISARSEGLNRGATFVVEFPDATAPNAGMNDTASPIPGNAGDGLPRKLSRRAPAASLRLLVVEDHEHTLQTLRRLLEREGHVVVTAGNVTEALVEATKQPFDLVISDLGLPDGTGIELMQKLRDAHGLGGIALSGYGMEEDIARSREAGFFAHLVKPIQFVDLRRALASHRPTAV